jgi:hypothetical protein
MACSPQDESLATLTPCSPRAKCSMAVSDPADGRNDVDFPSTPVSPASPHEDGELAHQAPANAKLPDVVDAQQPSLYTVINKQSKSTYLCSPEPSVALTPLIPKPAILQASCHLLPSIELGWRARSKPPDAMGTEHQPNINVNINKADADVSCLPTNGAVLVLPNSKPLLAIARAAHRHCLLSLELVWRARCKPPNVMGILGQCYPGIINKRRHMSAEHSLMHRAVLMLPNSRPMLAYVRAINPSRLNDELIT